MFRLLRFFPFILFTCLSAAAQPAFQEPYRPQIHFSPEKAWMNDPNGLVFFAGTYHLFFQYYPDSTVWGPMHWGHAVSPDLIHWKARPIALFPDSLGYIFSGSAAVDSNNTSGFGKKGQIPLIAVFTQHDPKGAGEAHNHHFQNQSIAYSLDSGSTWIKYSGNPVLRSPDLKDFRDPKLSWFEDQKKWIITLAAGDRILFYSSPNLKTWKKESEFGQHLGAHGGVWECPDLVSFTVQGKKVWLLIVNINPGGPQGGSATQYFAGQFDGHRFVCQDTATKWADYGADNYAGVTWSNTGNKKIFLGWMSNWQYATKVPTERWRSAMTVPRKVDLKIVGERYFLAMQPVPELDKLIRRREFFPGTPTQTYIPLSGPARIDFKMPVLRSFFIRFSNAEQQEVKIGFDEQRNAFYIDRTQAGRADFDEHFAGIHHAPRISQSKNSSFTLILDNASVEFFADEGLTTMTEIFFPDQPFNRLDVKTDPGVAFSGLTVRSLQSIWTKN